MPATISRLEQQIAGASRAEDLKRLTQIAGELAALGARIDTTLAVESPRLVLEELHADNGRIDARKTAAFLGVPLKQLAEGLGLNYQGVHRSPSGQSFQQALRPVKRTLEYLQQALRKPATIRAWLNTPHPLLENKTSLEMILEGKAYATERLLGNAWEGVRS